VTAYASRMKRRFRFAHVRWAASIAIAWPILSGALCPSYEASGELFHDGTTLYFVPRDSCFPRTPTVIELLESRHRAIVVEPFSRFGAFDPWPTSSRRPDGRIVL
jgi:hypothetical protein